MLSVDETNMPKAPTLRQLQDKDVLTLFTRDSTSDKRKYIAEVGVIYYLGDPNSPVAQNGLSYEEGLKLAIENYNLPKDYKPDELVKRLIDKYSIANLTEAGIALNALRKSIHLISIAANKINEILNAKLSAPIKDEDLPNLLSLMDNVNKKIADIPTLTKALNLAYDNLKNEEETKMARGGVQVISSMIAEDN